MERLNQQLEDEEEAKAALQTKLSQITQQVSVGGRGGGGGGGEEWGRGGGEGRRGVGEGGRKGVCGEGGGGGGSVQCRYKTRGELLDH